MRKFIKTGISLAACISFVMATAQEEKRVNKNLYGGFGHFTFIGQSVNINGLNTLLSEKNYGNINPNQVSWGGGGNFVIKNFVIGGEGAGFFSSNSSNTSNSLNFSGGSGLFNLGYAFAVGKHSLIYPLVGIGGGGYSIVFSQKNTSTDFNNQISVPNGQVNMQSGGILLNAQLAYQRFFCGPEREGFLIGIKAGYHYSPGPWKFTVNRNSVTNAPGINMNGPYVSIILGGGSVFGNK
jgi:hypothetical protein